MLFGANEVSLDTKCGGGIMNRAETLQLLKDFISGLEVKVDKSCDEGGDGEMYCYKKELVISHNGDELTRIDLEDLE